MILKLMLMSGGGSAVSGASVNDLATRRQKLTSWTTACQSTAVHCWWRWCWPRRAEAKVLRFARSSLPLKPDHSFNSSRTCDLIIFPLLCLSICCFIIVTLIILTVQSFVLNLLSMRMMKRRNDKGMKKVTSSKEYSFCPWSPWKIVKYDF